MIEKVKRNGSVEEAGWNCVLRKKLRHPIFVHAHEAAEHKHKTAPLALSPAAA